MTSAFWITAAAITMVTMVALLVPLMRGRSGAVEKRVDFDISVYKDQLAEIDRDMERGVLNEDQALAARTEIERRLLAAASEDEAEDDAPASPDDAQTRPRITGALILAMIVVVPLGAVFIYTGLGNPGMSDHPFASRKAEGTQTAGGGQRSAAERMAQLEAMIKDMERRVQDNPNDAQAWALLGQARQMMMQHDGAVEAFTKLVEITDRHPEALIALAEALFMQAGEEVTADALKLFKESRMAEPTNPMTYYYIALEREKAGDAAAALHEYTGLLAVSPQDAAWVPQIMSRMEKLAADAGLDMPEIQMLPPMQAAPAPGAGPTQEQVQQAQEMAPEDQEAMIRSMVERLANRLKDNPDDLAGWQRLAQAYRVLGDEAGLAEAQAQIKRLQGGQ